jgi:ribosome-associated translation inhibitor RaiA
MISINFKNLDKSELIKDVVHESLSPLIEKFPQLRNSKITVTLEMENSPFQAGPDLFKVKLHVANGRFKGVTITKADSNIYRALAEIVDHLLEKFNRTGDKERVKKINKARRINREIIEPAESEDLYEWKKSV